MKVVNFQKVKEEPVKDPAAKDVFIRLLVGGDDGAKKFHMRRFRLRPGGHTPHHAHDWEHEIFVLAGKGELVLQSGNRPLGPGDVAFVDPNLLHQFRAAGDADFEFLCLIPAVPL